MKPAELPLGLPGAELLEKGLADLIGGWTGTREALLVSAAAQRLRGLGLQVPHDLKAQPEIELYRLLGTTSDDPFTEYRALRSRLDSCIASLELIRQADHGGGDEH